jgi:hypothetical protein
MSNKSPHTVAHRRSLAHRVFKKAANARDLFLGKRKSGEYLPTLQKYFTGISLKRYLLLVCIEYPLILIVNVLNWIVVPCSFLYMLSTIIIGVNNSTLAPVIGIVFLVVFCIATAISVGAVVFLRACISVWAEAEPSLPVMIYKNHMYSGKDPDFDDFPEKFPGPIALLKKWLLSADAGESSQITWDSGKKRAGW